MLPMPKCVLSTKCHTIRAVVGREREKKTQTKKKGERERERVRDHREGKRTYAKGDSSYLQTVVRNQFQGIRLNSYWIVSCMSCQPVLWLSCAFHACLVSCLSSLTLILTLISVSCLVFSVGGGGLFIRRHEKTRQEKKEDTGRYI